MMQAGIDLEHFKAQRKIDTKAAEDLGRQIFNLFSHRPFKPHNSDAGVISFLEDLAFAAAHSPDDAPEAVLKELREGLGGGEFNDWSGKDPFFDENAAVLCDYIRLHQGMEKKVLEVSLGVSPDAEAQRTCDRLHAVAGEIEELRAVAIMVDLLKASLSEDDRALLEKHIPAGEVQQTVNRIRALIDAIHKPLRAAAENKEEPLRTFARSLLDDPVWRGVR